jgi:Transposase IS66 family
VVYSYAPGRGHAHAATLLGGYRGILQCDGYKAYKALADSPLCQSSCRADKIGTFGGADSKQWLGTDRHTRTG